jgi:hypothetical protein
MSFVAAADFARDGERVGLSPVLQGFLSVFCCIAVCVAGMNFVGC